MDDLYKLTGVGLSILDLNGNILANRLQVHLLKIS